MSCNPGCRVTKAKKGEVQFFSFTEYAYLSEHTDLRNVMGMGIAITRGSAAAMSFCYSLLLLTMARNLLTKLKETPLYQYIPIDSYLQFHKVEQTRTVEPKWRSYT